MECCNDFRFAHYMDGDNTWRVSMFIDDSELKLNANEFDITLDELLRIRELLVSVGALQTKLCTKALPPTVIHNTLDFSMNPELHAELLIHGTDNLYGDNPIPRIEPIEGENWFTLGGQRVQGLYNQDTFNWDYGHKEAAEKNPNMATYNHLRRGLGVHANGPLHYLKVDGKFHPVIPEMFREVSES